jgi:hypothetical protein
VARILNQLFGQIDKNMFEKYLINIAKSKPIFTVFVLLLISTGMSCNAQNLEQDSLKNQFTTYQENTLQEKLYIHTDKDFYLNDEICWFKIYCVDAFFHQPLVISKVVYVEILDKNNKAVLQAKISLKEGFGNGSLKIPAFLGSGKYKMRAYTNWMKNFSADCFFEKTLTIINSKVIYEGESLPQNDKIEIAFFPEGGNLVNGIQSKIAFQVLQNAKGVSCNGVIINEKSDTLTTFSSLNFGLGNFIFTPISGQNYKAIFTLNNGTKISQDLPNAFADGYVMQLSEAQNNQIKITVRANKAETIYLFAHTRGITKSVQNATIQNGYASFLIDKDKLGDGISHFTVFNAKRQAVCERLYFKYPKQKFNLDLALDKPIFETRNGINLHIKANEQNGKPTSANLSMAVYQIDSLQTIDALDINNYLWLSSDLAGKIESPAYYFLNEGIGKETAIDNLMLTHGWRKFRWEEIFQNPKPTFEFSPEYVGHIINGKITETRTNLPAKGIQGFLSVASTRTQFRMALSDTNGHIKFDMKDFYNNGEIIVQVNNQKDSLYNIEITGPFSEKYTKNSLPTFSLSQINAQDLINYNIGVQIQNVYSSKKLNQFTALNIDTTAFYDKPDETYLLDNYVRFPTIEEVLREYVTPVLVRKRNDHFHLSGYNLSKTKFFDSDPLVILDGMPIFNIDKLMAYNPLKIKKLDIISRQYHFGNMSFDGILNFVTYTGTLPNYLLDPQTTIIDYEGLQMQRDFYSPIYDTQQKLENRLPDFRNLLYWSPEIIINQKGTQDLTFYSSDLAGKFVAVVQGITKDGKTGSQMIQFEVKKQHQ